MTDKEEILHSSLGKKALNKTLFWLGKRSYPIKQLEQKLQKIDYNEEIITAVIHYCLRMGYLNDQEYVREWVATLNRLNPIGRRRVLHELKLKGIDTDTITNCLDASLSEEQEYELAASLIKKKIGNNSKQVDDRFPVKLYQFLLRRGFSHYTALKALNNVRKESCIDVGQLDRL